MHRQFEGIYRYNPLHLTALCPINDKLVKFKSKKSPLELTGGLKVF